MFRYPWWCWAFLIGAALFVVYLFVELLSPGLTTIVGVLGGK